MVYEQQVSAVEEGGDVILEMDGPSYVGYDRDVVVISGSAG